MRGVDVLRLLENIMQVCCSLGRTDDSMMNNGCSEDRFSNSVHANGPSVCLSHGASTCEARWWHHAKVKLLLWYEIVSVSLNRHSNNKDTKKKTNIFLYNNWLSPVFIYSEGVTWTLVVSLASMTVMSLNTLRLFHENCVSLLD